MLPFSVTIPASVPQRLEILEVPMNYLVLSQLPIEESSSLESAGGECYLNAFSEQLEFSNLAELLSRNRTNDSHL
jgi:hypothetical protein